MYPPQQQTSYFGPQQADAIRRYHAHLDRLGRAPASIDTTARLWISRFARQWRARYAGRRPSTCAG